MGDFLLSKLRDNAFLIRMRLFIITLRKEKFTVIIKFPGYYTEDLYWNDSAATSMNSSDLQKDVPDHESRPYKCPNPGCRRSYATEKSLHDHMQRICQKPPTAQCPYCPYKYHDSSKVRRHIKMKHKGMEVRVIKIRKGEKFRENASGTSGSNEFTDSFCRVRDVIAFAMTTF